MGKRVAIVGTGQTNHSSRRWDVNGRELINEAVTRCLENCELTLKDIDALVIGNMAHFEGINYMDTWSVDGSGAVMKPIFKVSTGGTTGTSLAIAGYSHVASGLFDRVLAIGWEKNSESDTSGAIITCSNPIWERHAYSGALPRLAAEASAYMAKFGVTQEDAARVAVRERTNAKNNPYAHLRDPITVEDVMNSPMIASPVKLLDMCPRSDGACAVLFASENVASKIRSKPVWIHAVSSRHDLCWFGDVPYGEPMMSVVNATREVFQSGNILDPVNEIDVAELYLPSSYAGLKWIEDIGFVKPGGAPEFVWAGQTDMGGKLPINLSGGVMSTNCIGATGLIRVAETAIQIMGEGGDRQVPDVKVALATGFGGCTWSDAILLKSDKP